MPGSVFTYQIKIFLVSLLLLWTATANGQVTAHFTASDTAGCLAVVAHFTNTSTGATSYSWDLGNGSPPVTTDSAAGSYTSIGSYTVTLTAFGGSGSSTYSTVIRVYGQPTVNFTANHTVVCPGAPITFTSTTVANAWGPISYTWNFGDGGSSSLSSPSYYYLAPGNYNTALYAVNSKGCVSSLIKTPYIKVLAPAAVAYSAVGNSYCTAPAKDSFINTTTGFGALSYAWTFGDGSTSTIMSPAHTYSLPGSYVAKVTVTDGNGCTDTAVRHAGVTVGNLKARFSSSKSSACIDSTITFTDSSDAHISSKWYFGDGTVDTVDDITLHTYSVGGTYNVKHVISNGTCSDSVIHAISIIQPSGSFTNVQQCLPLNYFLFNAVASPGSTITWDFGDHTTGTGFSTSHTFPNGGEGGLMGDVDSVTMTITNSIGCVSTVGKIDTSFNPFLSVLTIPAKGCVPLTVAFSAQAISALNVGSPPPIQVTYPHPIVSYLWDFGDGSPPSTLPTPSHTYTSVGIFYPHCHTVTSNGCNVDTTYEVPVGTPQPVMGKRTPSRTCAGQPVTFTNLSTSHLINEYQWEYGDGGSSPTSFDVHTYLKPGIFTSELTVLYNGCPCLAPLLFQDTIDAPGADIRVSYTCIPNNGMIFSDSSIGADTREWNFGDGATSTAAGVTHYFPTRGTYNVRLATYNAASGCRDTAFKPTFYLRDPDMYIWTDDITNICMEQTITVNSGVLRNYPYSLDTGFNIFGVDTSCERSFKWYDNWVAIDSTNLSVTATFHAPGYHDISFVILDNHGCYDTITDKKMVLVAKPVDSFIFTPTTGCGPLNVIFTDKSKDVPGVTITNYTWKYGDGTKDLTLVPHTAHAYEDDGTFTVMASIKDNFGCIDTFTSHTNIVVHRPKAGFSASSTYTCVGDNINFSNYSTGSLHWTWFFGDGATSTAPSPDHIYTTAGTYDVKLVAFDPFGCTDTLYDTGYIVVNPVPKAAFHMDDSFAVCPPLSVHFINTSSGASSNFWTFGDGTSSSAANPADIYLTPQSYKVKLTIDNIYGCTDTAISHAIVFGYSGAFTYTPLSVCSSSPVHFSAVLTTVTSIVWDFDDGITSGLTLLDTISHRYMTHGAYVPKLILTDSTGCKASSTGTDTIKVDSTTAGFTTIPDPGCVNSSIAFTDTSSSFYSSSASWLWTFAPGATSTLSSPAYTYSVSGSHPVTLKVTSNHGCVNSVTENILVNSLPPAITGSTSLCNGFTISLSDPATGGVWSSTNTSVATINTGGLLTGVSPGTTSITYQLSVGCPQYETVQVDSLPSGITGITTVCAGLTTKLSDLSPGGIWTCSNTTIATIVSGTGWMTGVATGTATVTYKLPTGCITTIPVTVNNSPTAIIGPSAICTGVTYNFSDAIGGGTWTTSNTAIAIINPGSGAATGLAANTVSITYALGSGCATSNTITVVTNPSAITGKDSLCAGSGIALSDPTPGGIWSSSNTAFATVSGPGSVAGIAGGIVTISYTIRATCAATVSVTVNSLPASITGATYLCTGLPTVLTDATSGGKWSSLSGIVTVDALTGSITGITPGTAIITYAMPTGCNAVKTVTITLSPLPISGIASVCVGYTTALSDATSGGAWSSSNTINATVGTGVVFGRATGTAIISYVLSGCPALATVTVNPIPTAITGSSQVCAGAAITLTDAITGGTWGSLSTTVAIGGSTGVVTGLTAGTAIITYTSAAGCYITKTITVNPLPSAISGNPDVCVGLTTTLSDVGGGNWSSSSLPVATVVAGTGVVTGKIAGTSTITYTLTTGCYTTEVVTVNPLPLVITGADHLCAGSTATYSDATSGGNWSSSNTTILVFDPGTAIAHGMNGGTATITYSLATGCIATKIVTVNPLPSPITGAADICIGFTTVLSDITPRGTWSSGNTASATIGRTTGILSAITAGSSTITYTLATGCAGTKLIVVNPLPSAISGATTVCEGQTTNLSDTTGGGVWSSSNTSVAAIAAGNGTVTGIAGGTATITYTLSTGCSKMITVTVTPQITSITGTPAVCKGLTTKLADATPAGSWSSSNNKVAGIDATGLVSGLVPGTSIITYQSPKACGFASITVTVNPLPDAGTISGAARVCSGSFIVLTDTATGGLWSSGSQNIANVDVTGIVTGIAAGIDTIFYTYTNICGTARTKMAITVNETPDMVRIVTHPDTVLCSNTLFMNFGTDSPEPAGERYIWSADNAVVYAISSTNQYCLISFMTPGKSIIRLSANTQATDCSTTDSIVYDINSGISPDPQVVYYAPEFVCKDNTADNYQWGYDDVSTLDSTLLTGMKNENYYNVAPDFAHKNYWVLTNHQGCLQKSYYNAPTQINNVVNVGSIEILLFPNPADSKINIEVKGINAQDLISAKVYNMIGKELKFKSFIGGTGSIELTDLPSAAYMVVFSKNGEKIGTRTFIKN